MRYHSQFRWNLGTQTQVLIFIQPLLYRLNRLPSPTFEFKKIKSNIIYISASNLDSGTLFWIISPRFWWVTLQLCDKSVFIAVLTKSNES